MANLIAKKLAKQPIGTHVEVTYGDGATHHETVIGIITDSDFAANVEITARSGEEIVLDFAIVRGLQVTKTLEAILREIPEGTKVKFSYGSEDQREPNLSGTVVENDCGENVEIKTASGEDLVLNYALIRSLLVQSKIEPSPKPASIPKVGIKSASVTPKPIKTALHQQTPEDWLNMSDKALKDAFDVIPLEDRKLLFSTYDSFKYGVKINDRDKMAAAANHAKQIIFREEQQKDYYWSCEAVRFCGYMLRRTNCYDHDLFLVADCFEDAAYAAWREGQPALAGAYAVVGLLEEKPTHIEDMVIILASSVVKGDDISGLKIFRDRLPVGFEPHLRAIIKDAFLAKDIQISDEQDVNAAFVMLSTLYPNHDMAEELNYWLPEGEKGAAQAASAGKPVQQPVKPAAPKTYHGVISKLNWSEHTGTITGDEGNLYSFRYQDITDSSMLKAIQECLRSDLGGKVYMVKFNADKNVAKSIQPDDALVDRARAIMADTTREDRMEVAFDLCKRALATPDIRRALGDMIKHALALYKATQQISYVKEALDLYEKNITFYPSNAFAVMDVALCYEHIKKYPMMMEHAEKALSYPGLLVKQRIGVLTSYLRIFRDYYDVSGDKALLTRILEKIDDLRDSYSKDFAFDRQVQNLYATMVLPYRVIAECGLDMLDEAEADYAGVSEANTQKPLLDELVAKLRIRMAPKEAPVEKTETEAVPSVQQEDIAEESIEDDYDEEEADEVEEEIAPYVDADGWRVLKLAKKDVIDYALSISGPDRIPSILAYLRAAASMCQDVTPVYHAVALAANDPMEAPDYSITALINALATSDMDYPMLTDCCMGAAFLRASFLSGRGYDYSAQSLRDSISISQQIPALREAYDTLEQFRCETGRALDIYADYRNQGVKKLNADMDAIVRRADELYTKYILTPPREKSRFARILETKKALFSRDGYLATMLRYIMNRNQDAMESEKANFITTYLSGADQFSAAHIDFNAVEALVVESWDQAGKNMQLKKANATLQGNLRNNLRSNVSEIITMICQWYALSEQSAGLSWRTEQGADAYARLRPQLMSQLEQLHEDCMDELETCDLPELSTGLFLLASTAKELSSRLDGTWKFDQEKYLYVDFLRSNHIMLDENFMPELTSTFCVLPEFNILARIRKHIENPKLTFQQQIDQIFGMEKTCNNYGTANRIVAYLDAMGGDECVTLPDNFERFISHTEMQVDMGFRDFRETYALAMNYGQIIKSDAFCYTLEDTVRYWYAFCKETKNYGFFTSVLLQAKNQIHTSARIYEEQLEEQVDALITNNRQYFDKHPDYGEAIRAQVANQNFTVAEDWMARIRIGDFSLDVQQTEALGYLEDFWNSFPRTYGKVVDASRHLSILLNRRDVASGRPNKDVKRALLLIDNWLSNGRPSNADHIQQLLNLLGWQNIQVSAYSFASDSRAEIYEVRSEASAMGLTTPQHPIAAFGSALEKKRMHVACLYGTYDCDRLYEKMRSLDVIDGSKIILLDYALGQADRRALARKLKRRESGLRNVYIVIDRVLITHLANSYNENLINRILMAIAMPFSYCQPYVVDSAHTMPPEIFIGRKDELLKIEQVDGVNLIYGGRQLGKSALFKKALADLEGRNHQRAVLIDIKELDCAAAARKLSTKLIDLGITPDAEITDDWDILCRNIERRLRNGEEEISYFLLMLDEADAFINDCANCGYRPLVALKDVQQSLPGQFKYVLAGLHNIVKFNRQVALGNNSVITHMPSLKITPFRTPEAQELLTGPLSYLGFSLPSKVTVSQILATCNYFPGLIQLYAKKLIESIRAADYAGYDIKKTPPYVVSDEHLRRVMADKEFVDQIHEKFEITLTLDQDQGSCYYPLTLLIGWMYNVAPSKNGYTAKDVVHHARDLSVYPLADLDEEKIDALLLELQDLNILRSVSNNSYLLASKNFRDLLGSDDEIFDKLSKVGGVAV